MRVKKYLSVALIFCVLLSSLCVNVSAEKLIKGSGLTTDVTYDGNDLGATYTKSKTTFKVWAPTATQVVLNRYSTGSNSEYGACLLGKTSMKLNRNTGVWSCIVTGDLANTYYTYSVTVDGKTNETQDVYSKATGVNGERSMVVDMNSTDPKGWEDDMHVLCDEQTDAVIWELHVRDFSISATSGVADEYKGKFLAFTQGGTRLNGDLTTDAYTCMDYLVEQGIKYVHLNPIYDFGSVDETKPNEGQYNWGYDPVNYNVPDGSYSTNPYDGDVRIKEFKQMIQAFHDRGIGVVIDVVYNHTYSSDSCFQITVPNYYYRLNADGSFSNGSGCGNETKSEAPMFRKYMIDSVTYWAKEYHIDGFRFDLMGLHDITTMNEIRNALDDLYADGSGEKILMYGEPWTGGGSLLPYGDRTTKENADRISDRIAFFNDVYRDAVKGHAEGSEGAFLQGSFVGKHAFAIKASLIGNVGNPYFYNTWASKAPTQNILYTSAHDNFTLFDKFYASLNSVNSYKKYSDVAERLTMLSETMTLLGQGVAFTLAGEEFCRTKNGIGNSYNSPDSINAIDWGRPQVYNKSAAYYKGLVEIRNAYSPFTDGTLTSSQNMFFSYSNVPEGCIAYTLSNDTKNKKDEWDMAAVLVNANTCAVNILLENSEKLPDEWVVLADGETAGLQSLGTVKGNYINVPARSSMVLVDKDSYESLSIKARESVQIKVNHLNETTGEILKTEYVNYRIGDTYRVEPDNTLSFYYDYVGTTDKTSGLVRKNNDEITFCYEETDLYKGTVTVNYLDESGEEIKVSSVTRKTEDEYYSCKPPVIQGYQLDTERLPNDMVGIFGDDDVKISFYYKELEEDSITVHYSNIKGWSDVYFYCFNDNEEKFLGAWPGKRITDTDEEGWYVATVTGVGEAKFIFNDGKGNQDSTGYSAFGEVYIDNGNVTFDTHVIVSHVDTKGNKVSDDEVITYKSVDKNTTYVTAPLDPADYIDTVIPENYTGYCKPGYVNVVYVYSDERISHRNPTPVKYVKTTKGDCTGDGAINMHDVVQMQRIIAHLVSESSASKLTGDIDNDGTITLFDVVEVQRYCAGLIDKL